MQSEPGRKMPHRIKDLSGPSALARGRRRQRADAEGNRRLGTMMGIGSIVAATTFVVVSGAVCPSRRRGINACVLLVRPQSLQFGRCWSRARTTCPQVEVDCEDGDSSGWHATVSFALTAHRWYTPSVDMR